MALALEVARVTTRRRRRPTTTAPARRTRRSDAPRPLIERIGLAAIAAVLAALFGGVAVAAWVGGEPFLAVMGGIGCLMTAWVGGAHPVPGLSATHSNLSGVRGRHTDERWLGTGNDASGRTIG